MSYSEYLNLTVADGSSTVLSDIPARADHREWMGLALAEGKAAGERGEIPIGAVVMDEHGTVVASAGNTREREHDPSAHAEVNAIRQAAARLGQWRLEGCTLVVTVEPCLMCAGTILASRVSTVVLAPGRRRRAPPVAATMCCGTGGWHRPPRCMRGCAPRSAHGSCWISSGSAAPERVPGRASRWCAPRRCPSVVHPSAVPCRRYSAANNSASGFCRSALPPSPVPPPSRPGFVTGACHWGLSQGPVPWDCSGGGGLVKPVMGSWLI